jgi:hypothetical protein
MSPGTLEHMKKIAGISHLVDDNNSPKGNEINLTNDLNNLRINDMTLPNSDSLENAFNK